MVIAIHPVTLRHPLKPTTSIKSSGRQWRFIHDGRTQTFATWQEALEAYALVGYGRLEVAA
jgi:hypothetical protein